MISILSLFNLISVLLSLTFQILLVRFFGAHLQTDVYYLSITIVQFITGTFSGFIMDLYIPVYNEIKAKDEIKAKEFAGGVFVLMLIVSSIIAFLVFIFSPYIVKIFATGFNPQKIDFAANLLKILSLNIIFVPLTLVLNSLLQAHLYLKITYFLPLFSPLFNILALFFFSARYGIYSIGWAMVFSSIFSFSTLFYYTIYKKLTWRMYYSPPFSNVLYLLKQNLPMRLARITILLKSPITTNILSYFPIGYLTLYSYTNRLLNILFNLPSSPLLKVFYIKASQSLPYYKFIEIKRKLITTLNSSFILFLICVLPFLTFFKKIFLFLFFPKLSTNEVEIMYHIFILLLPFYLLALAEAPFVNLTEVMKKGWKILFVATINIILYSLLLLISIKNLKIYSIPLALSIAQIYNTITFINFIHKNLKIVDRNIIRLIFKFFISFIIGISISIFLNRSHILFLCGLSIIILYFFFFFLLRKEVLETKEFLFKKDEIK